MIRRLYEIADPYIIPVCVLTICAACVVTILAVTGCATKTTGGTAYASEVKRSIVERVDGTKEDTTSVVESGMSLPENAEDGGSASTDSAGAAVDGGSQVPDGVAEARSQTLIAWGVGLMLLAGVVFSLRFTSLPFAGLIPWTGCAIVGGIGAALLVWETVGGVVAWVVVGSVVAIGLYYAIHNGVGLNLFKKQRDELKANGAPAEPPK